MKYTVCASDRKHPAQPLETNTKIKSQEHNFFLMPGVFCVYNKLVNEILAIVTLFVFFKKLSTDYDINTPKE